MRKIASPMIPLALVSAVCMMALSVLVVTTGSCAGRRQPGASTLGVLSVAVLGQNTRTPISDAMVTIVRAGSAELITKPGTATNDSGLLIVDGVAAGTYLVTAAKTSYAVRTQQIAVESGVRASLEILLEPSITPVPLPPQPSAGSILQLVPIYFGMDSFDISPYSAEVLKDHASLINSNPGIKITIVGSCDGDSTSTHEYSMAKGMRRAKAAYDYLLSLGVPADRMTYKSMGDIKSLPGEPPKHWKNRRVEFTTESK